MLQFYMLCVRKPIKFGKKIHIRKLGMLTSLKYNYGGLWYTSSYTKYRMGPSHWVSFSPLLVKSVADLKVLLNKVGHRLQGLKLKGLAPT
eukprot:scaffold25727_cov142-Cylindrotheca_fusiformis.AAC.6